MFYPGDARVPEVLQTEEFLVRPLRATDVILDYDAVISSRAELFPRSGGMWPREGFTLEENEVGMRFLYTLKPRQESLDMYVAYGGD